MKYSVNTYSFGKYIRELGIYGIIDKAAEIGFEGIEFVEDGWMNVSDGELVNIGNYARSKGLQTVGLCVGADFLNGENECNRLKGMIDRAVLLGVPMLRHDISSGKKGVGYYSQIGYFSECCRTVTEYGESVGIKTVTENHGFFSQDADRVEALITAVSHPNFGALVDLGNFMCADEDPIKSVSKMIGYAFHVHAKDFFLKKGNEPFPGEGWFKTRGGNYLRGTVIGHGDAGIFQSVSNLCRSGYNGWISVEFEGIEDNLLGISLGLDNLKKAVGQKL